MQVKLDALPTVQTMHMRSCRAHEGPVKSVVVEYTHAVHQFSDEVHGCTSPDKLVHIPCFEVTSHRQKQFDRTSHGWP